MAKMRSKDASRSKRNPAGAMPQAAGFARDREELPASSAPHRVARTLRSGKKHDLIDESRCIDLRQVQRESFSSVSRITNRPQLPASGQLQKREEVMGEVTLNIFGSEEIIRLKAILSEVVLTLPKQQRSCEMQASIAERILKLAAEGEKDPIRLKERTLRALPSPSGLPPT
jgi:hypothetical protein